MNGLEQDAIVERLDQIIRQSAPDVETLRKYGGTLYTLKPDEKEVQFCGLFQYKDHVQLAFSNGAALKDPNQVLIGTGKFRRHINFSNLQQIDPNIIGGLIESAVAYSLS
ncbi:DUF1801 domain-containing protein [Shimia sp.]|uniref:DUF1801 domain-containing protein n=1 Tax=Shimia sp. TaxID=1954381 RepID=UPI0032988EA8